MKWTLWPVTFLALLGILVTAGAGWAQQSGETSTVVAQNGTPTPTPTPILSYLPWLSKDPTPTPTPTPSPTPTPTPLPYWTGQYFNNPDLSGSPVLVRSDRQIDFDWGDGSPDNTVPSDGFSARWTRTQSYAAGNYNFFTYTDDGVRLWIDDQKFIDEWRDGAARQYMVPVPSLTAGNHTVKMEYYDRSARAAARLGIVNTSAYPQQGEWGRWMGEYFDNKELAGDPRMVRTDDKIDFDWVEGSPDVSIPNDNFSVRWTASLFLKGGNYDFFASTDDGVRLYVDGARVLDEWRDQGATQFHSSLPLSEGFHLIRMEYYDLEGSASARLWWHNGSQFANWRAEYYTNKYLSGIPAVIQNDAEINFDWQGPPVAGVPYDGFSVRWTGILFLEAGNYTFKATADDGVRLWVDEIQGLNEWRDQGPTEFISFLPLGSGVHFVRMEYYQNTYGATARLSWTKE